MKDFVECFEQGCEITPESGRHTSVNKEGDITAMADILHRHKVFVFASGRSYSCSKDQKANPIRDLEEAVCALVWQVGVPGSIPAPALHYNLA